MKDGVYIADGDTWIFHEGSCFIPEEQTVYGLHEYPVDLAKIFILRAVRLVYIEIGDIDILRRVKV